MHSLSSALVPLFCCAALAAQEAAAVRPELHVRGFANDHAERQERVLDRMIVRFRVPVDVGQLDAALQMVGLDHVASGYLGAFEIVAVPPDLLDAWIAFFSAQDIVEYAEPDYLAYTCEMPGPAMPLIPNDPFFSPYQWNFFDRGMVSASAVSNYGVNAVSAWNTTAGAGVVVAVLDTGIAYENFGGFTQAPDLAGATFVSPFNFVANTTHANDDNGHGTHVAGTIRQSTNNSLGVAGLAYQCALMPVKVLNSSGSGSHSQIANGINWAANNGADVINMSLGSSVGSSTLSAAVSYAANAGVVICAATGNTGRRGVNYPALYSQCIAVGATRFDGLRAQYSTYGTGIDVVAPGGDTSRDQNGDGYGDGILQQTFATGSPNSFAYYFFQGTSMATPHVAAIAALVIANQGYTAAQVRSAIETSCLDRGSSGYDTTYGWGIVDAASALTR
jgi:serine protease